MQTNNQKLKDRIARIYKERAKKAQGVQKFKTQVFSDNYISISKKGENMTKNRDCELSVLACDYCGWIERPPFAAGDECICGGHFRFYDGKISKIGNIEFVDAS